MYSVNVTGSGISGGGGVSFTHLDQDSPAETGFHQRFGHPAGSVGGRAVYLCVVLPREGSASVSAPTAVSVHNDLSPSQTSVTL